MRCPSPWWCFPLLILLTAWPLAFSGCKKKDPSKLDSGQWVARNLQCAGETLSELEKRVLDKVSETEKLIRELQDHLQKNQCPVGKHPDCIPDAGIQAIATLISSAGVSTDEKPEVQENTEEPEDTELKDVDSLDAEALNTAKKAKRDRLVKEDMGDTVEEPKPTPLPDAPPASETEPRPEEIARKAGCGMEVPTTCTFLSQDTVVSKLTAFVEQAAQLEQEVQRYLEATGQTFPEKPLQGLFEGVRTLESQIHELVTREELAGRRKGDDEAFFQSLHPQIIKGILSDLSLSVPKKIIADLKLLVPLIQKSSKFFDQHQDEWNQKVGASIRHLHKSQRVHANGCLERPNCWQFRQCVKRYSLPGILMLE